MLGDVKTRKMWSDLANNTMAAAGIRAIGMVFAFLLDVIISRQLGVENAGIYFLALGIVSVLSVIGRLGLDNAMLKLVAKYADFGQWRSVNLIFTSGIGSSLLICSALAILLYLLSEFIAVNILDKVGLNSALRIMCFGVVSFSIMRLVAASLRGLKRNKASLLTSDVIFPVVGVVLVYPAIRLWGVGGACAVFVMSTVVSSLVGAWFWQTGKDSGGQEVTAGKPVSELLQSSKHLYVMSLMVTAIQPWIPLLLLGYWAPSDEVAIYGVALRLSVLLQFFNVALNIHIPARYVELFNRGEVKLIGELARKTAFFVTLVTSPLFVLLLLFGDDILAIFGEEFRLGYTTLVILVLGQITNNLTGSVGYILIMTGHEKEIRNISIVSNVFLVLACLIFIPLSGPIGAAISMSLMFVFRNSYLTYSVFRLLGIVAVPTFQTLSLKT